MRPAAWPGRSRSSQCPLDRVEALAEFIRTGRVPGRPADQAEPVEAPHRCHPALERGQDVLGCGYRVLAGALPQQRVRQPRAVARHGCGRSARTASTCR